jgi:hypothetical protein
LRRDLISVAARIACHGRGQIILHLPQDWHRETEWMSWSRMRLTLRRSMLNSRGALALARLAPRADCLLQGRRSGEFGRCFLYQGWYDLVPRLGLGLTWPGATSGADQHHEKARTSRPAPGRAMR